MSKYTTEVRFICESYAGLTESVGLSGVDSVIEKARGKVFDFAYPIFDVSYKKVLETKILKHFYTREICAESVGLWKLWLNTRMNEIMPYYNKLYKSELLDFNPLYDTNITRTSTRKNDETDKLTKNDTTQKNITEDKGVDSSSNVTFGGDKNGNAELIKNINSTDRELYSDTPQGSLANIENETYLTNATKKIGSATNTDKTTSGEEYHGNENSVASISEESRQTESATANTLQDRIANTTEEYLESVVGKTSGVSYAKLIEEYRRSFLNIDMLVINELSDLFLGLW